MLCSGLNFVVDIYLGVTAEERKRLQPVKIKFEFQNKNSLFSKIKDNSSDYICYQKIAESIYNKFNKTEVYLLEYICYQIYLIIKSYVSETSLVNVIVKKTCKKIVADKEGQAFCKYIEF